MKPTYNPITSCLKTHLLPQPSNMDDLISLESNAQNSLRGPPPSSPASPTNCTYFTVVIHHQFTFITTHNLLSQCEWMESLCVWHYEGRLHVHDSFSYEWWLSHAVHFKTASSQHPGDSQHVVPDYWQEKGVHQHLKSLMVHINCGIYLLEWEEGADSAIAWSTITFSVSITSSCWRDKASNCVRLVFEGTYFLYLRIIRWDSNVCNLGDGFFFEVWITWRVKCCLEPIIIITQT